MDAMHKGADTMNATEALRQMEVFEANGGIFHDDNEDDNAFDSDPDDELEEDDDVELEDEDPEEVGA